VSAIIDDEFPTLWSLLRTAAMTRPDAVALLAPGRAPLNYAALFEHVVDMSEVLSRHGSLPSLRVAVVLPNGPEMASTFLAVASCAVCVPLNPGFGAGELKRLLEQTRADVVVAPTAPPAAAHAAAYDLGLPVIGLEVDAAAPAGRARVAADAAQVAGKGGAQRRARADDTALILHTSGTTARPKIVPIRQRQLIASAHAIAAHLALSEADRCLNVMPLFHIHGLIGALCASMAATSSVVCLPGFAGNAFVEAIAAFGPTWYTAVPTIHLAVLDHATLYRSMTPGHQFRFVRSCSAALPQRTLQALRELIGAPVVEAYGMTEATHQIASNPLPPGQCKPGSVGRPVDVDVALLDAAGQRVAAGASGEIAIRGPAVIDGYEGNAQADAAAFHAGWLRTGDEGRIDGDGYLYITGRLKDIVNRGGEKIAPREVEDALLEHPDVVEAVAYGVPHPTLGEDLRAAVVLTAGAVVTESELRRFAGSRLVDTKLPSTIMRVDAIPRGATGKVQRAGMAALLGTRTHDDGAAFADDTEREIAAIYEAVLGGRFEIADNFFAAGGDSLKGAQVVARVNARFGVAIAIPALFQHPTVRELAHHVAAEKAALEAAHADLSSQIDQLSDEEVARLLAAEEADTP
jgi:acyl-CoA synthetase (AMP-forming)/AMP-acid ligase II/acyl carrier protein